MLVVELQKPQNKDVLNGFDTSRIWLILFYDGVSYFKSKNGSFWVVLLSIANLPPILRNAHTNIITYMIIQADILDFQSLLYKHMSILENLLKNGITINGYFLPVNLLSMIGDAPARAKFLNTVQFNGRFGCLHCLNPGERVYGKRVNPYSKSISLRSNAAYRQHVKVALEQNKIFKGIKGICIRF